MPVTEKSEIDPKGVEGNKTPRDYKNADQQADVAVDMTELSTVAPKNENASIRATKKGGKGAKSAASKNNNKKGAQMVTDTRDERFSYDTDSRGMRSIIRCASCLNEMTSSKKYNNHTEEFQGKKMPKDPEGNFKYKSPGAKAGQYAAPLCDGCEARYQRGEPVDFKHAVIIDQEGSVRNLEVAAMAAFK